MLIRKMKAGHITHWEFSRQIWRQHHEKVWRHRRPVEATQAGDLSIKVDASRTESQHIT